MNCEFQYTFTTFLDRTQLLKFRFNKLIYSLWLKIWT